MSGDNEIVGGNAETADGDVIGTEARKDTVN